MTFLIVECVSNGTPTGNLFTSTLAVKITADAIDSKISSTTIFPVSEDLYAD